MALAQSPKEEVGACGRDSGQEHGRKETQEAGFSLEQPPGTDVFFVWWRLIAVWMQGSQCSI